MTFSTLAALDLAGVHARLDVFGVLVIATVTAIGGGMRRDVLLGEIPVVLRRGIYALSAIAGAAIRCDRGRLIANSAFLP